MLWVLLWLKCDFTTLLPWRPLGLWLQYSFGSRITWFEFRKDISTKNSTWLALSCKQIRLGEKEREKIKVCKSYLLWRQVRVRRYFRFTNRWREKGLRSEGKEDGERKMRSERWRGESVRWKKLTETKKEGRRKVLIIRGEDKGKNGEMERKESGKKREIRELRRRRWRRHAN